VPRTLRLLVEYDGTAFSGWQRQDGPRTVQQELEEAFAKMVGGPVYVQGAGRTDAGVHAAGQVASVVVEVDIPTGGFLRGLNSHLPPDVAILDVAEAPESFDARRSARGKVYRYRMWNHPVRSPLEARTSWHVRKALDVAAMRAAARLFVGEHDFAAFRASDCERRTTVRHLSRVDVDRRAALVTVEVEGTAFLKNMVRIITGTLVAVGHGALDEPAVAALLAGGSRTDAGMTAPAQGLTLLRVIY
jgi:tRNA pseudouridine38-40 synthase